MKIPDSVRKIYVLGPAGVGKSTFIQKHFAKEISMFEGLVIESSEMVIPENAAKIFLVLPDRDTIAERRNTSLTDSSSVHEDYFRWLDFYNKNQSKISMKWVKVF